MATTTADEKPCDPGKHEELLGVLEAVEDAHQFWHDCQQAYQDPEEFRRRLDVLIQASRTITWRLQSSKHAFPGFDQWYGQWQAFMRANPRLAWAHEARNDVVKRSGLDSRSRARVTVVWSYLEPARSVFDLPPQLSVDELVAAVARPIPEPFAPNSVMEIERRWEVDELPGEEILEVRGLPADDHGHRRSGSRPSPR
jgi:hypothetical protein